MLNAYFGDHIIRIPDGSRATIPTGLDILQGRAIVGVWHFEETTMMRRVTEIILLVLLAAGAVFAQAPKPESKTIVLKAARLFDGKSNVLMTPGMVVVSDGKIAATGANANVPAGAEVIDLGDATLLPGFIDAHTHLTMMYTTDYKQAALDGLQKTIPEQTLDSIANAKVTLMAGFTTVRDVGSHHFIDVGLRNAIRNGKVPGPRMLVSVHAIGTTGGHCDDDGIPFRRFWQGNRAGRRSGQWRRPDALRGAPGAQIWCGHHQDVRFRRRSLAG